MAQTATGALLAKLDGRRPADKYVVWIVLLLAAAGIVAVYSAISFLAETKAAGDTERFLLRHVFHVALALAAMAVFSLIDYRKLAKFSRGALICSLLLLVSVQIVGVTWGGAERWIRLGAFGFQPSDLARVALLLYVGVLLARKQAYIKSFTRAFVPVIVWVLITCALIGRQDLSTALIVLVSAVVMSFVARVSVIQIGGLVLASSALAVLLLFASPGRAARVEAFVGTKLFPNTVAEEVFDVQREGYQAHQARIAFAMGGLFGVGPGKSVQRDFLPAPYNDFIFAIIAEEYGLFGALALLAVFIAFLFRGFLRIARNAPDPLGLLLGVGLTTMVVVYAFVHAAVSCALLPVTGLPMPFVSYGGTSLLSTGVMIGILLNISRQSS